MRIILHIWGLSTTEVALTAHVVVSDPRRGDELLREIGHALNERFRIGHATIQVENGGQAGCVSGDC